jgi:hypothetical protein
MTPEEIEAAFDRIRRIDEARQKNWRSIRRAAAFCAGLFVLGGLGFQIAALVGYAGNQGHVLQQVAAVFVLMSAPLTLLRAALADPVLLR